MRSGPTLGTSPHCAPVFENKKKTKVKDMASSMRKPSSSDPDPQQTLPVSKVGSTNGYIRKNQSDRSLVELSKKGVKRGPKSVKSTQVAPVNGMKKSFSDVNLVCNNRDEGRSVESSHGRDIHYDSDSDGDKDQRVMNWLIGTQEVAEPPEEPNIEHTDEPPQRDTAIRIVYDGDS